jgi:hypothetical protein
MLGMLWLLCMIFWQSQQHASMALQSRVLACSLSRAHFQHSLPLLTTFASASVPFVLTGILAGLQLDAARHCGRR